MSERCSQYDRELGAPERCGMEIRCIEYVEFGQTYRQWLCPLCEGVEGRDVTDEEEARFDKLERERAAAAAP